MKSHLRHVFWVLLGLSLLAAVGGLFWQTLQFTRTWPGGASFARHWMAARAFLYGSGDPYADAVAQAAQTLLSGTTEFAIAPRVDLPFYLLFFYFPFASAAQYPLARALWMTPAWLGVALMAGFSLSLTTWRPRRAFLGLFLLFGLLWPHNLRAVVLGSNVIWQAVMLLAGLLALRAKSDELAGAFFVLAAFRWQAVLPFFLTLVIWLVSQRRWQVFAGSGMTLTLLLGLSFIFKSDWVVPWLKASYYNLRLLDWWTVRGVLSAWWPAIGQKVGWGVQAAAWLVLVTEWALMRKRPFRHFLWVAALSLSLAPLLGLPTSLAHYALFFLPITISLAMFDERWKEQGRWVILLLTLVLLAGSWGWFYLVQTGVLALRSFFFPLPVLTTLGLYWARWWAVRTPVAVVERYGWFGM